MTNKHNLSEMEGFGDAASCIDTFSVLLDQNAASLDNVSLRDLCIHFWKHADKNELFSLCLLFLILKMFQSVMTVEICLGFTTDPRYHHLSQRPYTSIFHHPSLNDSPEFTINHQIQSMWNSFYNLHECIWLIWLFYPKHLMLWSDWLALVVLMVWLCSQGFWRNGFLLNVYPRCLYFSRADDVPPFSTHHHRGQKWRQSWEQRGGLQ